MKVTIKNQEYKLLHEIPKGTKIKYNDEECIKAGVNLLVAIDSGTVHALPPTKKIYVETERKRVLLNSLSIGNCFILNNQLYSLVDSTYSFGALNFNTSGYEILKGDTEVELIQDENIQIEVK